MAVNPAHCLSLSEWKKRYNLWFSQADSISLLDIHVFFDMSLAWGEEELVDELKDSIDSLASGQREFYAHFARNCLQYKSPLNALGQLRSSERDGRTVINIKDCHIMLARLLLKDLEKMQTRVGGSNLQNCIDAICTRPLMAARQTCAGARLAQRLQSGRIITPQSKESVSLIDD